MKPTLVLLPGMDGTGDLFAPLLAALDPAVSTVVVRYPDEPLDYAAHEKLARAALPANERYLVLGESFSGPIAIAIAAAAPRGLLGYVLCCSFVRTPRPILSQLWPMLGVVPPRRIPPTLASYFLMGRFATPQSRRLLARALRRVSSTALAARLKAMARIDVGSLASRAGVPSLYLRATQDRLVPARAAAAFAKLAPQARVVDIEGPHCLLQCNALVAASVLEKFLSEVE
jgi:pimeloyl-[acyl-carrier protein] methyl ester esterase